MRVEKQSDKLFFVLKSLCCMFRLCFHLVISIFIHIYKLVMMELCKLGSMGPLFTFYLFTGYFFPVSLYADYITTLYIYNT